jgi:thiol-disulfide isomerase/thioredoxin
MVFQLFLIVASVVLIVVSLVYIYRKKVSPATVEKMSTNEYSIVYVYGDGCGHCQRFSPEWEKLVKMLKASQKTVKTVRVEFNDPVVRDTYAPIDNGTRGLVERERLGDNTLGTRVLTGVPAIFMFNTVDDVEKIIPYNGQRKAEDIFAFVLKSVPFVKQEGEQYENFQ